MFVWDYNGGEAVGRFLGAEGGRVGSGLTYAIELLGAFAARPAESIELVSSKVARRVPQRGGGCARHLVQTRQLLLR